MASTEIEYKDGQQNKPGMGGRLSSFKKGIWDGENKTFIGRTGSSWAKIGVFYLIYYICLAGFFAVSLLIFFTTVDDTEPSQTGFHSLIKSNPGLAFRPMPDIKSTLIKFEQGQEHSYRKYIDNIQSFLDKYKRTHKNEATEAECADGAKPPAGKFCKLNLDEIQQECNEATSYGYFEGRPCVLLKINKVFGWEPKLYSNDSKPDDLEKYEISPNGIFVTCEGENPSDVDNLGEVSIYPKEGFKTQYFPYNNVEGYQSPVVMVQMNNLESGVISQVWCKAWAKNIKHHKNDKAGSTHFEILMD